MSVVDARVVWASGNHGTVLLTTDGGSTWKLKSLAGASDLDFRDVHGVNERVAYILSIGARGEVADLQDHGRWDELEPSTDLTRSRGFLDAIAFWDADHGIAMGDPIDGRFTILTTVDGGASWKPLSPNGMPLALVGEGAFAASGTCLVVEGKKNVWFGTGGRRYPASSDRSIAVGPGRLTTRRFRPATPPRASSRIAFRDPITASPLAAIARDRTRLKRSSRALRTVVEPGCIRQGTDPGDFAPGRFIWRISGNPSWSRSDLQGRTPRDDGRNWFPLSDRGAHAVAAKETDSSWFVGEHGMIARFTITSASARNR